MTAAAPEPPTESAPYGTPEAPRIAVRGEAHLEVEPEIAHLGITVTARSTGRRETLGELTRRNTAVLDLLRSYGDAVEKTCTGSFSVNPELTRHGRTERIRAYHGRVRISVELADFTVLGELASRLADLDLTRVDGPRWSLRPGSPAHREARTQAARDAVARAREYAEALGATLAALVELADIGAEHGAPQAPAAPGAARRMRSSYGSGEETAEAAPLDLEPQRQQVHAQVNARFIMTPPRL